MPSSTAASRLFCASLLCACSPALFAQTPPAPAASIPLRDAQTLTESHAAEGRFTYTIDATAAGTYLLRVEQRRLDLIVTIEDPDGRATAFNSPLFRDASEFVLLEDTLAGPYQVTIYSDEHTGAPGGHAISYTELSSATQSDELSAWRLMTRGAAANYRSGDEAWAAAAEAYSGAAELWRELERTEERAQAVFSTATIEYWQLYDWDTSAQLATTAAELYTNLGEAALAANAVHLQAAALVEKALTTQSADSTGASPEADALFDEAQRLFGEARAVHERLGNVYELGLIINNLGYTEYNRGDFEQARAYFEETAALMQNAHEWTAEFNPRSNLAAIDAEAGYLARSIDTLTRIIELLPQGKLFRERANALVNLGVFHQMFGNAEQALRAFSTALEIQRDIDDLQGEGRSLRGIGQTYFGLGELDLATQYLNQALPLAQQTNDGRTQEAIFRLLGNIAYLDTDYEAALQHHEQAVAVVNSASDRVYLQVLVAEDLRALGRTDDAEALAGEARAAAEAMDSAPLLADALHATGRILLDAGEAEGARQALQRAAALYEQFELSGKHGEVLHSLSLAARAEGRLPEAIEYGEAALAKLESMRARVADPELRAFFFASRSDYYDTQIDLLMARHEATDGASDEYLHAALETSERSRARMTTDLLQEASVKLRAGFDSSLQQRQAELIAQLADLTHQRDVALQQESTASRVTALLAELTSTENQLNLLQIELRRSNPQFANLTAPQTLTVPELQALLDPDSVLLQYALGDARSFVWAVTQSKVVGVELADRATIEAAARRALEILKTPLAGRNTPLAEQLARLADLVLVPVAAHIDKPRVVLALDGMLQYIPFGALPATRSSNGSVATLLDAHEIVSIPSMSALVVQLQPDDALHAPKTLAIFADPVLDSGDPRLLAAAQVPVVAVQAPVGAAVRSSLDGSLGRLLATAREADVIAALVPSEQRFVAQGFAANRDAVLEADLAEYRFIHFATHGIVDSRYPGLSALALSQFDERGAPQQGFLRLNDIYNLRLNADLVVLSACETALGRDVRGEGLIGMTQGFMYAGARSVVASLWQVPDRATAELMTKFYDYMLSDGLRPAAALRSAQLEIAAERRWSNPYFWGGFVLVGDWQ